jgi:heat-inducible transcriptional repressor
VFVTDQGYVENKTFVIPDNLSMQEVEKNVSFLNDRLVGTPISQLVGKMEAMKPALTDYMVGEKVLYQAILEAFVKFTGERMALYGKEALFNQPEFNTNAEKLRKVLSLLDNPDELRKAVKDSKATPTGVKVHIGTEEDGMEDVSLVSAKLNVPGASDALLTLIRSFPHGLRIRGRDAWSTSRLRSINTSQPKRKEGNSSYVRQR